MTTEKPRVDDAPGLKIRPLKKGRWEARWNARTDLIERGFLPKSVRLWVGTELAAVQAAHISDRCKRLQAEMLVWSRGGVVKIGVPFDGTWRGLIATYQTDQISPYHALRYNTRINYDALLDRIEREHGDEPIAETRVRQVKQWYAAWSAGGKIAMAHSLIGMVRTLASFGAGDLENEECERLCVVLHRLKFKMPKPREEAMTAEQAVALRATAHEHGRPSVALAQAFQFDLMLRQRDVIGEWIPRTEPGVSDVFDAGRKWLRGLRWEEIDASLTLRHTTSKKEKDIQVDLTLAPMVMDELRYVAQVEAWRAAGMPDRTPPLPATVTRDMLPAKGPVIVGEHTARPWSANFYRREWRELATIAGIPKTLFSMDSRAGGITEATEAGADLEHIKHAATHSDIAMTQRYARHAAQKTATVMQMRVAHRNKTGTNGSET